MMYNTKMFMTKRSVFRIFYLSAVILFIYLPIVCIVVYSFNDAEKGMKWTGFTLKWYGDVMRSRELKSSLLLSLTVAAAASLLSTVIGGLGAIGANRLRAGIKGLVGDAATIPLVMPEIIMGVGLLSFFVLLSVDFGTLTLILAHTTFCIPFAYMMVGLRLSESDGLYEDAARDLGASGFTVFRTVTLPIIAPALAASCLISFAMSFDDAAVSFFVGGAETTPLAVKVLSYTKLGVKPSVYALYSMMLLFVAAVAVMYMFTNKLKKRGMKKL